MDKQAILQAELDKIEAEAAQKSRALILNQDLIYKGAELAQRIGFGAEMRVVHDLTNCWPVLYLPNQTAALDHIIAEFPETTTGRGYNNYTTRVYIAGYEGVHLIFRKSLIDWRDAA